MIEEEVISNEPVQEPPYKKKVYDILSSNFSDFKLGEQDFYKKLSTDKTYAGKVHDVLIENFSDFKKPKNEFIDSLTFVEPVKKKDQTGNLSGEVSSPIQSQLPKDDVTEWYKQTMPDAMFVKSTSDNTRLNKPREMAEDVLYKAAAPIREAKKKADTEIAIKNTAENYFKNNKIDAPVGSPLYNKQVAELKSKVDNGDAVLGIDKTNDKLGLKKTTGFWSSLQSGFNNSINANNEAADFVGMSPEQKVEWVKNQSKTKIGKEGYIGEAPNKLGVYGEFLGGAGPMVAKTIAGTTVGAGLAAIAPETGGLSMAGLPAVMAWAFNAQDMASLGVQKEIMRRYEMIKSRNTGISDVDAMKEASSGQTLGEIAGLAENTAFMMPASRVINPAAKSVLRSGIENTLKSAIHVGTVVSGTEAGKKIVAGVTSKYGETPQEILGNSALDFAENATVGGLLHISTMGAVGLLNLPKVVQSGIKYALKDVPKQDIDNVLKANVNIGNIPPDVAEKVSSDIDGYKEAADKAMPGLSPEAEASQIGLIQKKNKLVEESKTKDDSVKPVYKEQIESIDNKINDLNKGKPVYDVETDELTGNKYNKDKSTEYISVEELPALKETNVKKSPEVAEIEKRREAELNKKENVERLYPLIFEEDIKTKEDKERKLQIEEDKKQRQENRDKVNAKYDAELAALEKNKPIEEVKSTDIEAKKADIENKRVEELDNLKKGIPAMITKKLESDLKQYGFTDKEINKMTPIVANESLINAKYDAELSALKEVKPTEIKEKIKVEEPVSTQKVKIPGTKESKPIPLSDFTLEKEGERTFTKRIKKDEGGVSGVEPLNQFKLNQGMDAYGNPYPRVHIILDNAEAEKYQASLSLKAGGKKVAKYPEFRDEINKIAKANRSKTDEIVLDFRKTETEALAKNAEVKPIEVKEEVKVTKTKEKISEPSVETDIKKQIEDFGVPKEDVEPVNTMLSNIHESLKKAGLTATNTLSEWVGIGKGTKEKGALFQPTVYGNSGIVKRPSFDKTSADAAIKSGRVKVISPKESLQDLIFAITHWDDLFVGDIYHDGKKIGSFDGGVFYPLNGGEKGKMGASVNPQSAGAFSTQSNRSLFKNNGIKLPESFDEGTFVVEKGTNKNEWLVTNKAGEKVTVTLPDNPKPGVIVIGKGDNLKHKSSLSAKVGFVNTLLSYAKGKEGYDGLINAIKSVYSIGNTRNADSVIELFNNYLKSGRMADGQTMSEAKTSYENFRAALIKDANQIVTSMMRDMGYTDAEYFDGTQLKKGIYKATGKGIDKMFADIGQEDFLKGLKTGDAYAALKVTSPVFFEKDLGHPSYPFAIKTVDGSPVNIDIFDKTFRTFGENQGIEGRLPKEGQTATEGFGVTTTTKPSYTLKKDIDLSHPSSSDLSGALGQYESIRRTKDLSTGAIKVEKASGSTQRAITTGSYIKVANMAKELGAKSVLDYGAGFGLGSDAMAEIIPNVESFEPNYENWKGKNKPTFTNNTDINKKYDAVVSLNVLNVVPKETRDAIVKDIYNKLNTNGSAIISTRGWTGDIKEGSGRLGEENNSRYILSKQDGKNVERYQKGFDGNELVDYVKEVLGDNVTVKKDNSFGKAGVIITKTGEYEYALKQKANAQYRIESGKNIIEALREFNKAKDKGKAVVAITHEIMHPTVVEIISGAKEGNEVGKKHTQTIVDEFNKATGSNITVDELIKGNDEFKTGKTTKQYRDVQEFIAESWEKYHTQGAKGFSVEFQKVLKTITEAFKSVYNSLTGKELTPELKRMFDDILGKSEFKSEYEKQISSEGISKKRQENARKTIIDSNFDEIVKDLIRNNKIEKIC